LARELQAISNLYSQAACLQLSAGWTIRRTAVARADWRSPVTKLAPQQATSPIGLLLC